MSKRQMTTMFVVLTALSGCEHEIDHVVKAENLVLGDRNVEQTRGLLARATAAPEGSTERNYLYHAAMLNRATATLHTTKWTVDSTCRSSGTSKGSGTLTSDTRLTTAYHVVHGTTEPIVSARFETMVNGPAGAYANDGPSSNLYLYDDTTAYRWDASEAEENPLLSNRLFILSLHEWAQSSARYGVRDRLREHWEFVPDVRAPGESGYSASTKWHQGFVTASGATHSGKDIAILRALPLDMSAVTPSTGAFEVNRPALFFGKTSFQGEVDDADESNFVYLSHTNRWPNDLSKFVPLVSLPGMISQDSITVERPSCLDYDQPGTLVSNGLWRASHDALTGSSGGTFLVPNSEFYEGTPLMRTLRGFSILSGAVTAAAPESWGAPVLRCGPNESARCMLIDSSS